MAKMARSRMEILINYQEAQALKAKRFAMTNQIRSQLDNLTPDQLQMLASLVKRWNAE